MGAPVVWFRNNFLISTRGNYLNNLEKTLLINQKQLVYTSNLVILLLLIISLRILFFNE